MAVEVVVLPQLAERGPDLVEGRFGIEDDQLLGGRGARRGKQRGLKQLAEGIHGGP